MFNELELRGAMARKGYTREKLAKELDISPVTFWRKVKRGGDFSRAEINTIVNVLGIEQPERDRIFFADELT